MDGWHYADLAARLRVPPDTLVDRSNGSAAEGESGRDLSAGGEQAELVGRRSFDGGASWKDGGEVDDQTGNPKTGSDQVGVGAAARLHPTVSVGDHPELARGRNRPVKRTTCRLFVPETGWVSGLGLGPCDSCRLKNP